MGFQNLISRWKSKTTIIEHRHQIRVNARVKLCVIGKEIKAIAQGLAKLI